MLGLANTEPSTYVLHVLCDPSTLTFKTFDCFLIKIFKGYLQFNKNSLHHPWMSKAGLKAKNTIHAALKPSVDDLMLQNNKNTNHAAESSHFDAGVQPLLVGKKLLQVFFFGCHRHWRRDFERRVTVGGRTFNVRKFVKFAED